MLMSTTAMSNSDCCKRSPTSTFGASALTTTVIPNDRHERATNWAASQATGLAAFVVVTSSIWKIFLLPGECHLPLTLRQPSAFNCFAAAVVSYGTAFAEL